MPADGRYCKRSVLCGAWQRWHLLRNVEAYRSFLWHIQLNRMLPVLHLSCLRRLAHIPSSHAIQGHYMQRRRSLVIRVITSIDVFFGDSIWLAWLNPLSTLFLRVTERAHGFFQIYDDIKEWALLRLADHLDIGHRSTAP